MPQPTQPLRSPLTFSPYRHLVGWQPQAQLGDGFPISRPTSNVIPAQAGIHLFLLTSRACEQADISRSRLKPPVRLPPLLKSPESATQKSSHSTPRLSSPRKRKSIFSVPVSLSAFFLFPLASPHPIPYNIPNTYIRKPGRASPPKIFSNNYEVFKTIDSCVNFKQ